LVLPMLKNEQAVIDQTRLLDCKDPF